MESLPFLSTKKFVAPCVQARRSRLTIEFPDDVLELRFSIVLGPVLTQEKRRVAKTLFQVVPRKHKVVAA